MMPSHYLLKRYCGKFARTVPLDILYHKMVTYEILLFFHFAPFGLEAIQETLPALCEVGICRNMPEKPYSEYTLELLKTNPSTVQQ